MIGVLALVGAAMFVQWLGQQPPDWPVVRAVGEQLGAAAAPVVVPPGIAVIEKR